MAQAAGYILNVAASRREDLFDAIDYGGTFSEAVPEFTHSRNVPLVCFVGFKRGRITHLANGRRGARAGSALRCLNFDELVELPRPLSHVDIIAATSTRMRGLVARRLRSGGLLPPASFAAVVNAVRNLSPSASRVLARYSTDRRARIARLSPEAARALGYQKETVATALALAGFDRHSLQAWEPSAWELPATIGPPSFLDGLPQVRAREDRW